MSLRIGTQTALAIGAIAAFGLRGGPAASAAFENIYSAGHADIGVALEDNDELHLHYHFGSNAVLNGAVLGPGLDDEAYEYDPSEVTVLVSDDAKLSAPVALPFLGLSAGDPVWILPQSNNPLLPFVGIATEELTSGDWSSFSFSLTGFSGPGAFALFQTGLGTTVFWDTIDGIDGTDVLTIGSIGGHDHYNFGFSTEGVYDLTITATGTHRTLGTLSDTATFRFNVGPLASPVVPEPASLAMMGLGAVGVLGSVLVRRARGRVEEETAA
ncbi:choice-of-anchor M domain-containing protein [Tautonia sociabilis]|uniref:PEP-CTERM sorting domain-containing protein n=1 Tax=Tautonia sociabilis TaxID=2080755 RepID=A0A432MPY9_9BACT|nr:choice-of-anchor M domain-containing protein [Tautonia sociabilis]RUL89078.1 PEP-CTERM sorting domain-containing protein [Tautonia sociabilis]